MKLAKKEAYDISIDFKTREVLQTQNNDLKNVCPKKECFQTDLRYSCKERNCNHIEECKKLIAAWLR